MTRDEALAKWTYCRQCSAWKGNYTPEENDGPLARKLMQWPEAIIEEVPAEELGLWPSGQYAAMVKVTHVPARPARKAGPGKDAVMIPAEEAKCFYLAVR